MGRAGFTIWHLQKCQGLGSLAPQSEYFLRDTLILVENLESCQNSEQNNQILLRKSESAKDPAPCGESFEKAFISNIYR